LPPVAIQRTFSTADYARHNDESAIHPKTIVGDRARCRVARREPPGSRVPLWHSNHFANVQSRYAERSLIGTFGRVAIPRYVEEVLVEDWTYNWGPYQLMRTIRLENGFVTEIRQLGYGY